MGIGGSLAWLSTGEDAIVTDWASRTVTAGGSVATATRNAIDVYVKGIKSDSIFSKMSSGLIMPFASNNWDGALVPLIAPNGSTFTATLLTAADYSLAAGIDPGSANNDPKRIATNINAQSILTITSCHCSIYRRVHRTARDCVVNTINGADVPNRLQFHAPWENGATVFDAFSFNSGTGRIDTTLGDNTGFITGNRSASGSAIYRNGVLVVSDSDASDQGVPNSTINLIGCFDAGFSFYSRSVTSYIYVGSSLTASEEALHSSRVQTLQTALGRQV